MTCEDLKSELSFYLEDELTGGDRLAVEEHLSACPLCRDELAEYRGLSQNFKTVGKPQLSGAFIDSLQNTLRVELAVAAKTPEPGFSEKFQEWLRPKLLPYGVGTFASVTLFALLTLGIMLPANGIPDNNPNRYEAREKSPLFDLNDEGPMLAFKYASERSDVAQDSPSLNPNGALVAVTSAMTKRGGKNSEIVVVADVLSNGIARISEVVQPGPDEKTMRELEKAMGQEVSTTSSFVPARIDKRSDVVQIVLKIHEVEVRSTDTKPVRKARRKL